MSINQDWDIKPRGTACSLCQRPFADKQTYVSRLTFGTEGYLRRDYCFACWAKGDDASAAGQGVTEQKAESSSLPASAASAPDNLPSDQPQVEMAKPGGIRESSVSVWKAVFHPPPPPPEAPLKKETAESLLRSLIEKNEPARKNVIFILAVMLERQRLLVERDVKTIEDGSTVRVYEHRKTGDTFLVTDPHLDLNQLEHVQEEVIAMLGGEPETAGESASLENVQPAALNAQQS
jgi:hypothetical protein